MNATLPKHIIRPISSRFLQMLYVTLRKSKMLDYLTVSYYSYLTEEEKKKIQVISILYESGLKLFTEWSVLKI